MNGFVITKAMSEETFDARLFQIEMKSSQLQDERHKTLMQDKIASHKEQFGYTLLTQTDNSTLWCEVKDHIRQLEEHYILLRYGILSFEYKGIIDRHDDEKVEEEIDAEIKRS